jgi:hypothetical protein
MTGNLAADLTSNGVVDQDDLVLLIEDLIGTVIGDVDFDGRFDSHDLVVLFQGGQFEDAIPDNASYSDGDWNLDGEFTSDDLVFALQRGGYAASLAPVPRAAVRADVAVADRAERPQATSRRLMLQAASLDAVFSDSDRDWFHDRDDTDEKDSLLAFDQEI